jgi:GNAT superfamily N-acetyltransferase
MTLWRVRATLDDRPGFLAVLAASLGLRRVNILAVQVHATEGGAVDEFLVDTPDEMTEDELVDAIRRGRGRDPWVHRADARGLIDPPTQVLSLAARVVQEPDTLGPALQTLLGGSVSWLTTAATARLGADRTRMMLPDPAGGAFLVERPAPLFTPAEFARAQALVALAAAAERSVDALLLPDGTELTVRAAEPDDIDALIRMHTRCSPLARQRRYLSGTPGPSRGQLSRLLDRGHALVAVHRAEVVALANLVGEGALAEVALLVEDDWQRRGVGMALLRRLLTHAERSGFAAVCLHTRADNAPLLAMLGRLEQPQTYDRDGPLVTVTVALVKRDVQVAG